MRKQSRRTDSRTKGYTYLFSFPFWLVANRKASPIVRTVSYKNGTLRIYAPFQSATANFVPMPSIAAKTVPFLKDAKPKQFDDYSFLTVSLPPQLFETNRREPALKVVWGDKDNSESENIPLDSLRIDVFQLPDGESQNLANEFVRLFLRHIRIESGQWWIGQSVHPLVGYLRNAAPISKRGEILEEPWANVSGEAVGAEVRPINQSVWEASLDRASKDIAPCPVEEMYMIGRYAKSAKEYGQMILHFAMACELGRDTALSRLWSKKGNKSAFKKSRMITGYNLPKHLDQDFENLFGRSFKSHDSASFEAIVRLWRARNEVAHGVSPSVDELKFNYVEPVRNCISWLKSC